eukprot:maker-scaffold_10-snap-gene-4.14-mRNA-1 protein AED:0.18 eAED:0.18 QI:285/1/0.8/1/0.5/0.4/5/0/426
MQNVDESIKKDKEKENSTKPPKVKNSRCSVCMNRKASLQCYDCVKKSLQPLQDELSALLSSSDLVQKFESKYQKNFKANTNQNNLTTYQTSLEIFSEATKFRKLSDKMNNINGLIAVKKESVSLWTSRLSDLEERIESFKKEKSSKEKNVDIIESLTQSLALQYNDYSEAVARKRRDKIMQLVEMFPIIEPTSRGEEGVGYIGGLEYPTNIEVLINLPKQKRVAVLDLLARIISLSAKYLDLNLPFAIDFVPGSVFIGHHTDFHRFNLLQETQSEPLKISISMLNTCCEWMCSRQGVPVNDVLYKGNHILHNLWQLFHSPSLGRSVYQSYIFNCVFVTFRVKEANQRIGKVQRKKILPYYITEQHRRTSSLTDENMQVDLDDLSETSSFKTDDDGNREWDLVMFPPPPQPSQNDEEIQDWADSKHN